jgi:hypothetical protein
VPAGSFYWVAFVFAFLGQSVLTLRFAYALLGITSVAFSYLAFRVMFTRTIAVIATLLLAVSAWHLHYSRIAFIPIGWPLMQMATLFFLFLAVRRNSRWLYAAAGACLGGGIYSYQAFPIFAVGLALVVVYLAASEFRGRLLQFVGQLSTMLGVALIVGLPMASFARENPDIFTGRYEVYSVTKTEEYEEADNLFERVRVLAGRELDYVRSVISRPVPDGVDVSGIFPLVDRVTLGLLIVGGAIALWRIRDKSYLSVLILAAVIGAGPALAEEGWYRRTLGLTPLLALVAALPLALVFDEGRKRGIWVAAGAALVVVAVLGGVAGINLGRYFGSDYDDSFIRRTLAADLAETSDFIDALADGTYVYFYSDWHSFDYETRLFIAPAVQGEDRSLEFGGTGTLEADRSRDVAYVFTGGYLDQLADVMRQYPCGTERTQLGNDGAVIYAAYLLPRAEGVVSPPTPQATGELPPTPLAAPGGDQRDLTRQQHLEELQLLLEQFRPQEGSYPDTGGAVQTLCAFSVDAGCALESGQLLPQEPLGDPSVNGYWYSSDGSRYVLFAQRESEVLPACADHPAHLRDFDSLLCVHTEGPLLSQTTPQAGAEG